jgi:hypothetical protein
MMEVLRTQKHRSTSTRLHGAVSEREEWVIDVFAKAMCL